VKRERSRDRESEVLGEVYRALVGLDRDAATRVLGWVRERLEADWKATQATQATVQRKEPTP
jgi:hypothetical protein